MANPLNLNHGIHFDKLFHLSCKNKTYIYITLVRNIIYVYIIIAFYKQFLNSLIKLYEYTYLFISDLKTLQEGTLQATPKLSKTSLYTMDEFSGAGLNLSLANLQPY